jgi:hypothetical protein
LLVVSHASGFRRSIIATLDYLAGKQVYVRKAMSYFESLTALNDLLRKAGKPVMQITTPAPFMSSTC